MTYFVHIMIYAITGAFAGVLAGVLGIGGGMIIVPALLFIFHYTGIIPPDIEMHVAAGTSLAIMVFTAQSSIRAHMRQQGILWNAYRHLQWGIIVGTILGALLAQQMPTGWLKIILGVLLLFIAAEMVFNPNVPKHKSFPAPWINRLISIIIGFKSGLLGIGGGALIIPYLTYSGVERRKTAGVSAMCTLTVALIGTVSFILTGLHETEMPAWSTGYIYWPAVVCIAIPSMVFAPLGAHLTYTLPVKYLKYAFVVVLVVTAFNLLY